MTPDLIIYFDGACEPVNPGGIATAGWIVLGADGAEVASGHRVVARGAGATNNVAEWAALWYALRWLASNLRNGCRGRTLLIHGDSQLVCNQLTLAWNANKERLRNARDCCRETLGQLELAEWRAEWVPREQNERADELSKLAYVECTGKRPPERHARGRR